MATVETEPPSALIRWHINGVGTWVRDLEIISLLHMFVHEHHKHTAAVILQRWLTCSLVSRRLHPNSTGSEHEEAQRWDMWEPGQASGSSSSAQPLASGKGNGKKSLLRQTSWSPQRASIAAGGGRRGKSSRKRRRRRRRSGGGGERRRRRRIGTGGGSGGSMNPPQSPLEFQPLAKPSQ